MKRRIQIVSIIMVILFWSIPANSVTIEHAYANQPTIVIGDDINYPPYSFINEHGEPDGFNVELAKAVALEMGYNVEIRLDEWGNTRQQLEVGEIDAIAGMFLSEERRQQYSFTVKHSIANGAIFAKNKNTISEIEALIGKSVVVQKGDIVGEYLKDRNLNINIIEVPTVKEALSLVDDGTYDYAGVLKLPGQYTVVDEKLKDIRAQNIILNSNDYCLAVSKDNESLLMILNGGLKLTKTSGQYQEIYDKWLGVYEERTVLDLFREKIWLLILAGFIVLGLIVISAVLKLMVDLKTKELKEANQSLERSKKDVEEKVMATIKMKEQLKLQYDLLCASETALRTSEKRNQAILDALPDLVFIFDQEGRFIDCQVGKHNSLLMPKNEFIGKRIGDIFPEEIANIAHEKIRKAIEEESLQSFDYDFYIDGNKEVYEMRLIKSSDHEVIGVTRDVTSEKKYKERIEYLSYHDHLTGLYNRRCFEEELVRLDIEENFPLGIILGDLNGLKLINDSFGHLMGDKLLVKTSEVIKKACKNDEFIARIGGDEFVILAPNMSESVSDDLTKRIQTLAMKEKIGSINLSISFGWKSKSRKDESIQEIFNRAEEYMYRKKLFEGPSMRGDTIGAIINTLNEKNKREERHSRRVSEISANFAVALELSSQEIDEIKTIGLLHDIGKIGINEDLLNKPGKLSNDEYEEIKRHPEIGYRILSMVNDMSDIAKYILYHHERWDGNGYPSGLVGEDIPLQSRMITIADAYDAMTSLRSYRDSLSKDEAFEELRKCSGQQFDPAMVEPFIKMVLENEEI